MSESDKKPGLLQRLFGFGKPAPAAREPAPVAKEPAKKEPPSRQPARRSPDKAPAKKEPPRERPAKKEPPAPRPKQGSTAKPKRPAATPKGPPPAGPHTEPAEPKPEARPPHRRKKETSAPSEVTAPSSPQPKSPQPKSPQPKSPQPKAPLSAPHVPGRQPAPKSAPVAPAPLAPRQAPSKDTGAKPGTGPTAPAPDTKPSVKPKGRAVFKEPPKRSWFTQLRQGLARSQSALADNLVSVLTKRRLDAETLDGLEEVLIRADLGVAMAGRIRGALAASRYGQGMPQGAVREVLASEIAKVLEPVAQPLTLITGARPHVILIVGVNGTGKTTTAAKLAHLFMDQGASVLLAAADTFRAAAIDQLKVWGDRVGAEVVAGAVGADPAGVAYEALQRARAEGRDVLLIDTAGRLHNKSDLMAELAKIVRVLKKLDASAPHSVLLVLDATTGQHALAQVQTFQEIAGVTSLVVTKLDGTARGGILVAIAERFALPIAAIGVGEGLDDLRPFDAQEFARAIAGLQSEHEAAA